MKLPNEKPTMRDRISGIWKRLPPLPPIIDYLKRYWLILVVLGALISLYLSGTLGVTMHGALIIPIFLMIAAGSALLLRDLFNRKTTDPYVSEKTELEDGSKVSRIEAEWNALTPFQRILLTKVEFAVYLIVAGTVAAALIFIVSIQING